MDTYSFIVAGIMVYVAVAVFIGGMVYKIISWVRTPKTKVALGIFPKPKNKGKRFFKVLKDSFIFPHSFKVDKWMWIFAILFHLALFVALAGHFRLVREFTPIVRLLGENGMDTLSATAGGTMGIIIAIALVYYFFRRFSSPYKDLSVAEDFFILFLLIVITGLGNHMRFTEPFHVEDYRVYVQSLLVFKPAFPPEIANSPSKYVLSTHVLFVNLFVIYFPFGKLTHLIGTFTANTIRSE